MKSKSTKAERVERARQAKAERSERARHAAMMRWHPYRREGLTVLGAIAAVVMLGCVAMRSRINSERRPGGGGDRLV
jgi:hypothetical protein